MLIRRSIVLFIVLFVFVGCDSNKMETEKELSEDINLNDYDYIGTFKNGDELYIESYRYNMQDAARSMIILRDNDVYKIFDGMPTKPKFNKERTEIIYVDNLQFEAIGNVIIYDSDTEVETKYTDFDYGESQETVKDVEWLSENTVLCIIGYSYGTVSQGGELYILDTVSRVLTKTAVNTVISEKIKQPYEIVDVYVQEGGLDFLIIEWKDSSQSAYFYEDYYISFKEIEELRLFNGVTY